MTHDQQAPTSPSAAGRGVVTHDSKLVDGWCIRRYRPRGAPEWLRRLGCLSWSPYRSFRVIYTDRILAMKELWHFRHHNRANRIVLVRVETSIGSLQEQFCVDQYGYEQRRTPAQREAEMTNCRKERLGALR